MEHPQSQVFQDEFPLSQSCPALNEIRKVDEITDLTIEVKNGSLRVHKLMVAARFPALRASLRKTCGEVNLVLKWPKVPLTFATSVIDYAYTGQVQLTQANVYGIVILARMLRMWALENWGATFLAARVDLVNLSTALSVAKSLNIGSVVEACINLMKEQFQRVVPTLLFARLPADDVLRLLQKDDLPVDSEEEVFEAISTWICPLESIDQSRLELHASSMLRGVRWAQTTPEYRKHLVDHHQIFKKSNECLGFMFHVAEYIGAPPTGKPPCPFNLQPRQRVVRFSDVVYDEEQYPRDIAIKRSAAPHAVVSHNTATERPPVRGRPNHRTYLRRASSDANISGQGNMEKERSATLDERPRQREDEGGPSHRTFLCRCNSDTKRRRQRKIEEGRSAAAAASQPRNTVYIFGATKKYARKWSVLRYDPHEQQPTEWIADWEEPRWFATYSVIGVKEARWRGRASLSAERRYHAAAVLQADDTDQPLLGIFGGLDARQNAVSSCEVYDVDRNKWCSLPNMRQRRFEPAAACLSGDCRVFVFGGYNSASGCLASVECCRLASGWEGAVLWGRAADFWQVAADMRVARFGLAAIPFRGHFIVAGGQNNDLHVDTVELFRPPDVSSPRGQWTALARMRQTRASFTLLTSRNTVFALGSCENDNTIEEFTASTDWADHGFDLTSGRWSSRRPIIMVHGILGAALLRL